MVDPDLDSDLPEGGLRLREPVVDLGPQGVEGDPALSVPLAPRHLHPAQAAAALHPDAEGPSPHGGLHRASHGPAEGDPALQLLRHPLGQQPGVRLRPRLGGGRVHVLDLHVHTLGGDPLQVPANPLHLGALPADHDAGPGRPDEDLDLVSLAIDLDVREAGARQVQADVVADGDVLVQRLRVLALARVPPRSPGVDDAEPEAVRVNLLPHRSPPPAFPRSP